MAKYSEDVESSRSPTRSMLGRGIGEARRRIVLIIFLAFFLSLTVLAFRRQDTIKDVVNSRLHGPSTTTTTTGTKPETSVGSKPDLKSEIKPDTTQIEEKPETSPTETKPATSQASTKPDAKEEVKSDPKSNTKSETKTDKSKSKSKTESGKKGPKLGNGDRVLAASSVADIHNTTLGVRKASRMVPETLGLTRFSPTVREHLRYQCARS